MLLRTFVLTEKQNMKRTTKASIAALLVLIMAISACGNGISDEDIEKIVDKRVDERVTEILASLEKAYATKDQKETTEAASEKESVSETPENDETDEPKKYILVAEYNDGTTYASVGLIAINDTFFKDNQNVISVTIPHTVQIIGDNAFSIAKILSP